VRPANILTAWISLHPTLKTRPGTTTGTGDSVSRTTALW